MCVDAHDVCVCVCVLFLSCARQCVKSPCTSTIAKIIVIEMEEYNQNRILVGGGWPVGGAGKAVRACYGSARAPSYF